MSMRNRYTSDELSQEELEQLTSSLLEAKFDKETKQDFRRELAEKHGIKRPQSGRKRLIRWLVIPGAAAAIMLLLYVAFNGFSLGPDYQGLTQDYLAEYYPNLDDRKGTTDNEGLRSQARTAYSLENFTLAIELGEQLVNVPNAPLQDRFFLGLSYLYQNPTQLDRAIEALEQVQAANQDYAAEARFHLALALISDQQIDQARVYLETIVNAKGWKFQEAAKLLDKLPE